MWYRGNPIFRASSKVETIIRGWCANQLGKLLSVVLVCCVWRRTFLCGIYDAPEVYEHSGSKFFEERAYKTQHFSTIDSERKSRAAQCFFLLFFFWQLLVFSKSINFECRFSAILFRSHLDKRRPDKPLLLWLRETSWCRFRFWRKRVFRLFQSIYRRVSTLPALSHSNNLFVCFFVVVVSNSRSNAAW